jgi:hypothetical protein
VTADEALLADIRIWIIENGCPTPAKHNVAMNIGSSSALVTNSRAFERHDTE